MTAVEPHEPPERKEFIYTIDEDFLRLQKQGKCGEMQGDGKRCKNPVLEWFVLDPDRPMAEGNRVGACGTHVNMVGPRVKSTQHSVFERRVRDYILAETARITRVLRLAGFQVRESVRGSVGLHIDNPAEFMYTLGELGVLQSLGIDVEHVEQCTSVHHQYGSEYRCKEAAGHYPKTDHYNWENRTWRDCDCEPRPLEGWCAKHNGVSVSKFPEPPPVEDTTGGQFS